MTKLSDCHFTQLTCGTGYTLYPIAKCVWDYFSHYVVTAIDVKVELDAYTRLVKSSLNSSTAELCVFGFWCSIDRDGISVKKACYRRV